MRVYCAEVRDQYLTQVGTIEFFDIEIKKRELIIKALNAHDEKRQYDCAECRHKLACLVDPDGKRTFKRI